MCSLLSEPFGIPMSNAEIAQAINIRDKRKTSPIDANTVDCMFKDAQSLRVQNRYPGTCRYKKWEAIRDRLAARNGVIDGNDQEMGDASLIFNGMLKILN